MCEVWGRVKKRLPLLFCLWHEAQIVSDYNVLEDDYLRSLLKDGEGEKNPQEKEPEPKKTKKKKKSHLALIVCCCLIIPVRLLALL